MSAAFKLCVVHGLQPVQPAPAAKAPRAKLLTTDHLREAKKAQLAEMRALEAARLDAAMEAAGISSEGLAKHFGSNRDVVRKMRDGSTEVHTAKLRLAAKKNDGCRKAVIAYLEGLLADVRRAA